MIKSLFDNTTMASFTAEEYFICSAVSIVLGLLIALVFKFRSRASSGFVVTLAILPVIIQTIIMLVNGNVGTGVAVMGAFSLVRFRSIPGSAKEIGGVVLAMSVGLATGAGYCDIAVIIAVMVCCLNFLYTLIGVGETKSAVKELKITIPESLDYTGVFDDLFDKYTSRHQLVRVQTTNMGSLYKLFYTVQLKKNVSEKDFIDELRCRNGNLDIVCGQVPFGKDDL